MDNLTHSLAGLAVGELLHRSLAAEPEPGSQSTRRRMLLVSCWAANNFPDLDLLLSGRVPAPIGYLLDHRGHTHTLLYAVPQAMLIAALVWLLWPAARRLLGASRAARSGLALAVTLGLCMHIGADFLNSYGVHPFYPLNARWFYGDTLFIVEPVLWIAFGAPLAMMLGRRWMRLVPVILIAAVFAMASSRDLLAWGSVLGLAVGGFALAWLQHRAGVAGRQALTAGLALALAFIGIQALISVQGKQVITADLLQRDPSTRVLDIAMSPLPANPLCWSFVSVERSVGRAGSAAYQLRRGMYSVAPTVMGLPDCPSGLSMRDLQGTAQLGYGWTQSFELARLRALAATCRGNAWLRFARMPVWWGQGVTDARFSTQPGANFSTMELAAIEALPCPPGIPQWGMPREDLLAE